MGEDLAAGAVLALVTAFVVSVAGTDAVVIFVESDAVAVGPVIAFAGDVVTVAAVAVIMTAAVAVADAVAFVAGAEGWGPGACRSGTLRGL